MDNDFRTQDGGTADLGGPSNPRDNMAADLPCSCKLPDAEETMRRILNDGSSTGFGGPVQPTPEQILRAIELLSKANKYIRLPILRLLRQGGFDVGDVDTLADGPATDAEGKEDKYMAEFCRDVLPRAQWDLIPKPILEDLFNGWLKINHSDVPAYKPKQIKNALMPLADKFGWSYLEKNAKGNLHRDRPGNRMGAEEPMIKEYALTRWYGFVPDPRKTYAGLKRKTVD